MGVVIAFATGLGASIGSFLNVVVYRVPAGRSVVSPPSACPRCGTQIRWYDNVPVLSWLLLRARCRTCRTPISARYPVVELVTALSFAGVGALFGPAILSAASVPTAYAAGSTLIAYAYFSAVSIALALIDLDHHRLPNAIVLPSYGVLAGLFGLAALLTREPESFARSLAGAGILFGGYLIIALISPRGMGLGDVKLAGVIGLALGWLGWGQLAVGAALAFLVGGLVAVVLIVAGRARRGTGIPFGPCMLAGAWIAIIAGDPIWQAYLALVGLD